MTQKALICDWDCTLAEPVSRAFYAQHTAITIAALKSHFNLTDAGIDAIVTHQKVSKARLEEVFFSPTLAARFNLASHKLGDFSALHAGMATIDPAPWFQPDPALVALVRAVNQDRKIIILSNSSEDLIRRIGARIGFDMDADFAGYRTLQPHSGPPKYVDATKAMQGILTDFGLNAVDTISIGDSEKTDLAPARALGMKTALVDNLAQNSTAVPPNTPVGTNKEVLKRILANKL